MWLFAPLVWVFNGAANLIFRWFKLPSARIEDITADDIMAMADAGAQAGALLRQEQHLISNVFELDSRIVPSAMTSRENIVFLTLSESEESIRRKIAEHPHGKFPVCEDGIDSVIGYVDSKDILPRIVQGQDLSLRTQPIVRKVLMLPDTLTLFEALERFRDAKEDFALDPQRVRAGGGPAVAAGRDEHGDGRSRQPLPGRAHRAPRRQLLAHRRRHADRGRHAGARIEVFEGFQNYETVAGFLMYRLRKVPKRTDFVTYAGYKFEVSTSTTTASTRCW